MKVYAIGSLIVQNGDRSDKAEVRSVKIIFS
jgi:hypothetical protein